MIQRIKNPLYRLLRWSEKYTKTDMVYLASGGFWIAIGQTVSSLSILALAVLFANLVPPETYGTYKYVLSLASLFAIFSLPGMSTAISRTTARGYEGIIHAATRRRVLFSFVGSALALAGSAYYFFNGNTELSLALFIIAATLPVFDTFTGYLAHFTGKCRFDLKTKYHTLAQVVSVTVLAATLFLTNNLIIILIAYFFPLVLMRTIFYWYTMRTVPQEIESEEIASTLIYGNHLTAMQILGAIAGQIDKVLLWKFLGPVQLALYAFALAIPEQVKGPLKSVGELAFPKFATQTSEQIKANLPILYRKLALYALALFIVSLLYILAAPYIFQLLFPQYMESVVYSQFFSVSIVTGVGSVLLAIIQARGKVRAQYAISTVQPVIAITLFVLLIPPYGVMGAIIAYITSRTVTLALLMGAFLFSVR